MDIGQYLTLSYLYKLLKSNSISVGLVGISILFIFNMNLAGLMLFLLILLAIPFSFYMLYVLYLFEKKGWITGFIIFMGISFLPLVFLSNENLLMISLKFAPLLAFVFYNMALKYKVGEWLMEMDFERDNANPLNRNM